MTAPLHKPIIGITMGDPSGIGPEIAVKALSTKKLYSLCRPLIIGDLSIIHHAVKMLQLDLKVNAVHHPDKGSYTVGTLDTLSVSAMDVNSLESLTCDAHTGKAALGYILKGIELAGNKQISAVATGPVSKLSLKYAGCPFPGHTEIFAHKTNTPNYAMMMAGEKLKVVLVTIHIPLSEVADRISTDKIFNTIDMTYHSLKARFSIQDPKIAVAGLNPHSGEGTMFGSEETDKITPAIERALKHQMNVTGPLPPDTVFYQAAKGKYDAVIAMYHDQGLIPFKLIHFSDGVNTTLGLPIIRTSVDHGTAHDIAWQGKADPDSLIQAVKMAALQAVNLTENSD